MLLKNLISKYLFIFLIVFGSTLGSDDEDKYYFQIYPSLDQNNPHYLYALTNEKFLTFNATEEDNFKLISKASVDQSTYKNISSVIIINDTYLVKTCFMNNKLVEIEHNKNSFSFNKNLNDIKYCYSSQILNPSVNSNHSEKYVIITYYTKIQSNGKYSHNAILFYPFTNSFSTEFTLIPDSSLIINDYYPENCITLRDIDIYCSIHFTGHSLVNFNIIGNNYVIETDKLFLKEENLFLIVSNSITSTSNYYKKLIPLNRQENTYIITKFKYGIKDIYLTECHNQEDSIKTLLRFSYYIKDSHLSYIKSDEDYGLKISDKSINPNLLNYIASNEEEMLIIYINKDTKTNLLISRIYTKNIVYNYMGYAINNYYRTDICLNPVYMQSTYIKSFINYEEKDKEYMRNNPYNTYYKFEKNLGIVISCKSDSAEFQTIKVETPQCLNELDEINGNDIHRLKFTDDKKEVIFDIYNDPNMISFRNTYIYFNSSEIFAILISMKIKQNGDSDYSPVQYDKEYKDITHIKFSKNKFYPVKSTFKLPYILQNTGKNIDSVVNAMKSDICYLEFTINSEGSQPICRIDFCSVCESESICKVCDPLIEGLKIDMDVKSETFGNCICDENNGFQKSPKLYQMCICKDGYSFYKGLNLCIETEVLENGPYYKDDIEKTSNIPIYKDCPKNCKNCTKDEMGQVICLACINNYIFYNNECNEGICNTDVWFKLDKYIFKYLIFKECIFIFEGADLFLISDKDSCAELMQISNYDFISKCLNNKINITKFIDIENVNVYNSSSEGIIADKYSEDNKIYFHLVKYNNSTKYSNISTLELKTDNNNEDILIFKADIKRDDTISTQVEYQFYNADKNKIHEKINKKEENNDLQVILSVPIRLSDEQIAKINELQSQNIDPFDSSSPFYLDVCYKFTTQENEDMFLEDRKKEYFIKEKLCESNCKFLKFDYDMQKVICECELKENTEKYLEVSFIDNEVDDRFNKRVKMPNFVTIKCTSGVIKSLKSNFFFFITLFLLFVFVGFFIYSIIKGNDKLRKELKAISKILLDENDAPGLQEQEGMNSGSVNENPENNIPQENQDPIINDYKNINIYKRDIKNKRTNNEKTLISSNDDNQSQITSNKLEGNIKDSPNNNNDNQQNEENNINNSKDENNNNDENNKDENNNNNNENNNNENNKDENNNNENNNNDENNNKREGKENIVDSEKITVVPKKTDDKEENRESIKKDLICESRELSKSFQKISESIAIVENKKIQNSDIFSKINYSLDSKSYTKDEAVINEQKKEKGVDIEEINIYEEIKEEVMKGQFFSEEVVGEIDSPFKKKVVQVNTMLSKVEKKKKHHHKANPPKAIKSDLEGSQETFTKKENTNVHKEIISDDYILDKMYFKDFEKLKNDKKKFSSLLWSVIKNNSTLIFVFQKWYYEDIFVRVSLIVLFISLYLFLNTFLLYEMPMVKLFTSSFTFANFIYNTFIMTFFVSIIIIIIKKIVSNKEFIFGLIIKNENNIQNKNINRNNEGENNNGINNENNNGINNENNSENKSRKAHYISNETIPYARKMKIKILVYGSLGTVFLVFNCIFVTSFCGIYSNSKGELFINTTVSIIISTIVRILFFLIGVILRYYSFKRNNETLYKISRLFNPLNLSCEESYIIILLISKKCKKKPVKEEEYIRDRPPDS